MCMCMSFAPTEAPLDNFLSGTQPTVFLVVVEKPYTNLVHYYNYVCVFLLQPNLQILILNKDEDKILTVSENFC